MFQPRYPGPFRVDSDERIPYVFVMKELSEAGMDEAGLVLWQVLRDVRTWLAAIAAPEAPTLADEGWKLDGLVPELAVSLPTLDRLIRDPNPDPATLEAVAVACMHVGLWAEDVAAGHTALAFFQAAEDTDGENPHYAYNLGRVARKLALYDEAERWLKWAHWVARGAGRWDVAALSLSGLGNLHRQRGNLPLAMRFHRATRRIAQRHGLRTLEGDALYDLVGLSFDFGDPQQGMEYARRAIQTYGPGHTRIYRLAKDMAWLWMDRFGEFENAAYVFMALLDHVWEPERRVMLYASLARAAAGAGWRDVFERMWIESWITVRQQSTREFHAAALTQIAIGAGCVADWERARMAANEALRIALARGEGEMIILAESILNSVHNDVISEEALPAFCRDRQHMETIVRTEDTAALATELTGAMKVRRDDSPQGPARTHRFSVA